MPNPVLVVIYYKYITLSKYCQVGRPQGPRVSPSRPKNQVKNHGVERGGPSAPLGGGLLILFREDGGGVVQIVAPAFSIPSPEQRDHLSRRAPHHRGSSIRVLRAVPTTADRSAGAAGRGLNVCDGYIREDVEERVSAHRWCNRHEVAQGVRYRGARICQAVLCLPRHNGLKDHGFGSIRTLLEFKGMTLARSDNKSALMEQLELLRSIVLAAHWCGPEDAEDGFDPVAG